MEGGSEAEGQPARDRCGSPREPARLPLHRAYEAVRAGERSPRLHGEGVRIPGWQVPEAVRQVNKVLGFA